MTYLPQPRWHDYLLSFVLVVGGIALMTYATAPFIAGGIPALLDTYRGPK